MIWNIFWGKPTRELKKANKQNSFLTTRFFINIRSTPVSSDRHQHFSEVTNNTRKHQQNTTKGRLPLQIEITSPRSNEHQHMAKKHCGEDVKESPYLPTWRQKLKDR